MGADHHPFVAEINPETGGDWVARAFLMVLSCCSVVQAEDIVYASLADEVITIVTSSIVGTSNYRTLDELHSHLDPAVFRRVHRSHVTGCGRAARQRKRELCVLGAWKGSRL